MIIHWLLVLAPVIFYYKDKFISVCASIGKHNIDSWPTQPGKPLHWMTKHNKPPIYKNHTKIFLYTFLDIFLIWFSSGVVGYWILFGKEIYHRFISKNFEANEAYVMSLKRSNKFEDNRHIMSVLWYITPILDNNIIAPMLMKQPWMIWDNVSSE